MMKGAKTFEAMWASIDGWQSARRDELAYRIDAAHGLLQLFRGAILPPILWEIIGAENDEGTVELEICGAMDWDLKFIPITKRVEEGGREGGAIDFIDDHHLLLVVSIKAEPRATFCWWDHVARGEIRGNLKSGARFSSSRGSDEQQDSGFGSTRSDFEFSVDGDGFVVTSHGGEVVFPYLDEWQTSIDVSLEGEEVCSFSLKKSWRKK